MPIEVYTGKPGNGKTALMMERLMAEAKKGERPIYAAGIDGLQPGLATVLADPREWNAKDDRGEYIVPNGALIFIDEAWKWFGHLHDASRQSTPAHVLALAEHRHRGIDFVWTTQGPNQLYPFTRNLIADHYHCVRRFGTQIIDVFKWEELCEDIKSAPKREAAQRTTRALPKDVFGKYKSADVHTIKRKIPVKVLMLPLMVIVAGFLLWIAYNSLKPSAMSAKAAGLGPNAASAASGLSPSDAHTANGRLQEKPLTRSEYAKKHLPRFSTMPWTSEVFDGREVTADPQLMCMSSRAGEGEGGEHREDSCTCLTEQGTFYEISQPECRRIARFGPVYNPYRERHDDRSGPGAGGAPPAVTGVIDAAPSRAVMTAPQMSGYGDIGVGNAKSAP